MPQTISCTTSNKAPLGMRAVGSVTGHFWVPSYQRGYRWGEHEVNALLNDLHECATLPNNQSYCLQPVVVKERSVQLGDVQPRELEEGAKYFELIDGQQRLTTLYIIYCYLQTLGQSGPNFELSYETRLNSTGFLKSIGANQAIDHSNIDYFHMSTAFKLIQTWFMNQYPNDKDRSAAAADWFTRLNSQIKVIWFDAGEQNAIDLFSRLNAGRISLTNAELVKALLLADHGTANLTQQATCSGQWDVIEHALHDDAFWYFLSAEDPKTYPTRIDLLLDLIVGVEKKANHSFATFEWFQDQLKSDPTVKQAQKTQKDLWGNVWQRYTQLRDWFEDRAIYHRIGWLIATGNKLGSVIDKCMGEANQRRSAFKTKLDEQIKNSLNVSKSNLAKLKYDSDRAQCQKVLLLFNVMSVDQLNHGEPRYPFEVHLKEDWSLEHIHAQAAQSLANENDRRAWLEDSMKILESLQPNDASDKKTQKEKLVADIEKELAEKEITHKSFEKLDQRVSKFMNGGKVFNDIDALNNLALLSVDINTSLGNQSFPAKRLRLLEHDKGGRFIPICTRRAFFKYYTTTANQHMQFWSKADRDEYLTAITDVIAPFLK